MSGASYMLASPSTLAFDSTHIWVANNGATSLTQVNASDGSLARIIQLPPRPDRHDGAQVAKQLADISGQMRPPFGPGVD